MIAEPSKGRGSAGYHPAGQVIRSMKRLFLVVSLLSFALVTPTAFAESQVAARQREFNAMSAAQHLLAAQSLLQLAPSVPTFAQARQHLGAIPATAPERKAANAALIDLKKKESAWSAEQKKKNAAAASAQAALGREARLAYKAPLREHFLDQGFDIKVATSGKDHTHLDLQFALFNDVWVHRFQKGDLIQEIRSRGFTRVRFSDGYDYSVDVTFDGR